jgi:hypothetical protein
MSTACIWSKDVICPGPRIPGDPFCAAHQEAGRQLLREESAAEIGRGVILRKARLRAWKARGVPVGSEWKWWFYQGKWDLELQIWCEACSNASSFTTGDHSWVAWTGLPEVERQVIERVIARESSGDEPCPHLAPLLGDDPPEVVELMNRELLASDPPP